MHRKFSIHVYNNWSDDHVVILSNSYGVPVSYIAWFSLAVHFVPNTWLPDVFVDMVAPDTARAAILVHHFHPRVELLRGPKYRRDLFLAVPVYAPIISPQTLTIVRISIR